MDNRISVEFVLTVLDKATLLGEDMWIGATLEIGLNEIWAIQHSFTVIAPVPYVPVSRDQHFGKVVSKNNYMIVLFKYCLLNLIIFQILQASSFSGIDLLWRRQFECR